MTPEQVIDRAQGFAQSGAIELIRGQEVKIINRLVSAHHSAKLTDRDAAIGIAVIANIRTLISEMDSAVRQGVSAGKALTEQK